MLVHTLWHNLNANMKLFWKVNGTVCNCLIPDYTIICSLNITYNPGIPRWLPIQIPTMLAFGIFQVQIKSAKCYYPLRSSTKVVEPRPQHLSSLSMAPEMAGAFSNIWKASRSLPFQVNLAYLLYNCYIMPSSLWHGIMVLVQLLQLLNYLQRI